jgi:putative flavoprotein involved in K+ transport
MSAIGDMGHVDTLVIGGGQSGLTVGYYLAQRGIPFLIVDANARVGDAWRLRWDSLRLFTPARYNGLPGLRFPRNGGAFISKDEMADYLEAYARHFKLGVKTGVRVERLSKVNGRFVASGDGWTIEADNVVVAMASAQRPRIPEFARELDAGIRQLHSAAYKNPSQLRDGGVLIVGVGNSGADIGIEVARTHRTWLAGKERGAVPFRIEGFFARNVLVRGVRFVGHNVLNIRTPIGRKARPNVLAHGGPLVRVKPRDLLEAGIERVPRVVGSQDGLPLLADGRTLEVANVIWCTGYDPGFDWIDLPVFEGPLEPAHEGGIVAREPGLFFVGLLFLYAATSETVTGMQRDARRITAAIARRRRGMRAGSGSDFVGHMEPGGLRATGGSSARPA